MSLDRFLVHRVSVVRRVVVLDEADAVVVDEYNQPTTSTSTTTGVPASIQPRSARELASLAQAGAALSDHRIYMRPRDISTADVIVHVASACPLVTDLPDGRYEVVGVPSAAGEGHHLEIAAKLVSAPGYAYATPVGGGS